jgi:peptidyl-prolyl cis-trans isomerase D
MARLNLPEETLKQQALEKLIRDEVLLQYVRNEGLVVTDDIAREFIGDLPYFQKDGKFDKKQYDLLLASQGLSSAQFVAKIRNAITMEQFQRSVIDSSFATQYDIDSFYKIQSQQRSVEYITVPVPKITKTPAEEDIKAYFQAHQDEYQTAEQVAIEYIELSLQKIADAVDVTDEQLQTYYEDQKDLYTTKERRKISHILFQAKNDVQDDALLERARQAKARLETEDFVALAKELSDDKLTAKTGGDLGVFTVGVMEPAFELAASNLSLGSVSEPVQSSFGYHLIKVTELVPGSVKTLEQVKKEVTQAYKKAQAENEFDELGETLAEVSFENADNLAAVSDAVGIEIKQTALFSKDSGMDIAADQAIRDAAFSEEILNGNNSEPIELGVGADRLVVIRMLEHQPAAAKPLQEVKEKVSAALIASKAKQQVVALAKQLKQQLLAGSSMDKLAKEQSIVAQKQPALSRNSGDMDWQLNQAIFKAAKPVAADQPTIFSVGLSTGEQAVVSLLAVTDGAVTDDEKQQKLAKINIARALGQADFFAVLESLQTEKDIVIIQAE